MNSPLFWTQPSLTTFWSLMVASPCLRFSQCGDCEGVGVVARQWVWLESFDLWPPTYLRPLSPDLRSVCRFPAESVVSKSVPQSLSRSSSHPSDLLTFSRPISLASRRFLFLSFSPSLCPSCFFTVFLDLPSSQTSSSSSPSEFRRSSGESAWKEMEAEKGEKGEKNKNTEQVSG